LVARLPGRLIIPNFSITLHGITFSLYSLPEAVVLKANKIAKQYLDSSIRLPRLLLLMNFWAQFYITAKYGFEAEYLASAKDLFGEGEAELAIRHAKECLSAARQLRYLEKERLASLTSSEVE
jgi:hypothetical protein